MLDRLLATPWFDLGGEGPALILAHGGVRTHHDWDACLPALLENHRVIAVDLRGHGSSTVAEFDLAGSVADIGGIIDELQLVRPTLVGHSLGGIVAASYAAERDGLAGVVDVDALGVSIPPNFPGPTGEVHRQRVIERVAAMPDRADAHEPAASITREINAVDIFDLFERARVPTLFILATQRPELRALADSDDEEDVDAGGAARAATLGHWRQAAHDRLREIAAADPGLRVETVASTHMIPLRQPARLVELILEFTAPTPE